MILRKPYAFLIKHFKFIHLIMAILSGILIYQTNLLMAFFNEYVSSTPSVIGNELVANLFSNFIYIFVILIIIISVIIMTLMSFKQKPSLYYVINVVGYSLLIVLYIYTNSVVYQMQNQLVDARITRAIRDFLNIILIFQVISTFISTIRAIGFDLKKFNFSKDAEELDVKTEDNEEFEVNVEFDSNLLKRNYKKTMRNLKYYYVENKFIILMVVLILVGVITFTIYNNSGKYSTVYKVGSVYSTRDYLISVNDSYITSNDYRLSKVTSDDKSLVAVKIKIKTKGTNKKFIYGKMALLVDNTKYYPKTDYSNDLVDIGATYLNNELTTDFQEFLLVYEIPTDKINSKMIVVFIEQVVKSIYGTNVQDIKTKIEPINLDIQKDSQNGYKTITITDGILKDYKVTVNSFDVQTSYKLYYNTCVAKSECYNYYEYLTPSLSGISDKALLKVNATMELLGDNHIVKNMSELIRLFGQIKYEINGQVKTQNITTLVDTSKVKENNVYYFEVLKEVADADKVELILNARYNKYIFSK